MPAGNVAVVPFSCNFFLSAQFLFEESVVKKLSVEFIAEDARYYFQVKAKKAAGVFERFFEGNKLRKFLFEVRILHLITCHFSKFQS